MKPAFFDAHVHVHDSKFDDDREDVIERALLEDVWMITVGTDADTSKQAVELAEAHDKIFSTIGIHPTDNASILSSDFDGKYFENLVSKESVVAIGECGLDYFNPSDTSDDEKKRQKDLFEVQLEFAVAHDKPLMIHCRNAHEDIIDILFSKNKVHGDKLTGNIHFFSAGVDIAKKYLNLGFSLSFSGVITFADDYNEALKYAPLDMIMAETDCPYVAPLPYRGKRNEPIYVKEVVKKIIELRNEPQEKVQTALSSNVLRIFRI